MDLESRSRRMWVITIHSIQRTGNLTVSTNNNSVLFLALARTTRTMQSAIFRLSLTWQGQCFFTLQSIGPKQHLIICGHLQWTTLSTYGTAFRINKVGPPLSNTSQVQSFRTTIIYSGYMSLAVQSMFLIQNFRMAREFLNGRDVADGVSISALAKHTPQQFT